MMKDVLPAVHIQDGREVFRIPKKKFWTIANKKKPFHSREVIIRQDTPVEEILRRLTRKILLTVLKSKSGFHCESNIQFLPHPTHATFTTLECHLKNLLH